MLQLEPQTVQLEVQVEPQTLQSPLPLPLLPLPLPLEAQTLPLEPQPLSLPLEALPATEPPSANAIIIIITTTPTGPTSTPVTTPRSGQTRRNINYKLNTNFISTTSQTTATMNDLTDHDKICNNQQKPIYTVAKITNEQ